MNKKLRDILRDLAKPVQEPIKTEYDNCLQAILKNPRLSFKDVALIWGLSKKDSDIEVDARMVLPYARLQDELRLEISRRIKFPKATRDHKMDSSIDLWVKKTLVMERVPNFLVSRILEKFQIYVL